MNLGVSAHELGFPRDSIKRLADRSARANAILRQAGRVLAWLATLILVLVLAGAVYQAIAGLVFLILALADEVFLLVRRHQAQGVKPKLSGPPEACLTRPDLDQIQTTGCYQVTYTFRRRGI